MKENLYYLGFSLAPGIGANRFRNLLKVFGTATSAWEASPKSLLDCGMSIKLVEALDSFRKNFDIEEYSKRLTKTKVFFISQNSKEFPQSVLDLPDPPIGLFVIGNRDVLSNTEKISVVGSRKMTSYGEEVTAKITAELASHGITIVSGLALGVDAQAHESALHAKGSTIAVLGCGVDCCYPQENTRIYNNIVDSGGAVISEYPLSSPANKGSFVSRNRIIAALSRATLVTEAGENSGSLITAQIALNLNRLLFAVPGPITSQQTKGTSNLIKEGARVATESHDILIEYNSTGIGRSNRDWSGLDQSSKNILEMIAQEELTTDELAQMLQKPVHTLLTQLTELEIQGYIKPVGDGKYRIH